MKKILGLICLGLFAHAIVAKQYKWPDHRKYVACAFSADIFKCDQTMQIEALEWFIDTPINTVVDLMAFIGARVNATQKTQLTDLQKQRQADVAALEKTMSRQDALKKMAEQGKLLKLKADLHFDKWV